MTIPTLICGCAYSCLLYQNVSLTCFDSANLTYVERTPYTCLESPEFCNLPYDSEIGVVYGDYDGQGVLVSSDAAINCTMSSVTVFSASTAVYSAPLVASGSGCAATPDFTFAPDLTLAIYLKDLFWGSNGTVRISPVLPNPVFDAAFGLVGNSASFSLSPRTGCCDGAPPTIEVGNDCDLVEFLQAGNDWIATTPFDVSCATGSRRLANATEYFFNVTIFGNATAPCSSSAIAAGFYNASQINLDTSSPTFSPTFDPGRLRLVAVESALVEDVVCPTTVSGFAKPFFATRAETDLTPSFRSGSIWFPPSLFSVDSGDDFFNLTSGACVPQDQSCVSYWTAAVQVQATDGSDAYLANAAGEDASQCVARSQCYPGESENVDSNHVSQLVVSWPANSNEYAVVDIVSQVFGDEFITFDTLRVTYFTLDGVLRYDVSAQYKANVMNSPSYPEYSNGLFCRFNDTLFFVPPRTNAWTATNLAALNSTLCAFVDSPDRDRVMFVPSEFVFGNATYVTLTLEGFGQIRSNGSFVGCVYARSTIAPAVSAQRATPIVLVYELVFGIVGGLFVVFVVAEIARRKRFKRRPPVPQRTPT